MVELNVVRPDARNEPDEEASLGALLHRHRVNRFVETHGVDALPPGALRTTIDEHVSPDIAAVQLQEMLEARRVLHGLTPDGKDPNAATKPRPIQQAWSRDTDD